MHWLSRLFGPAWAGRRAPAERRIRTAFALCLGLMLAAGQPVAASPEANNVDVFVVVGGQSELEVAVALPQLRVAA